jgi:hypothetical protein
MAAGDLRSTSKITRLSSRSRERPTCSHTKNLLMIHASFCSISRTRSTTAITEFRAQAFQAAVSKARRPRYLGDARPDPISKDHVSIFTAMSMITAPMAPHLTTAPTASI